MADNIIVHKGLSASDVFKGSSKAYSTLKQAYGSPNNGGDEALKWFMVERDSATWSSSSQDGDLKNLFASFGIARSDTNTWTNIFNIVDKYNAKRMIIATIPQSGCGSYIDGSTVELRFPKSTGTSSYHTFYGSSYIGYPDPETGYDITVDHVESNLGAMCYLFPNYTDVSAMDAAALPSWSSMPYTGSLVDGPHPNTTLGSWTAANQYNSTFYPHLSATREERGKDGYDIPYGIGLLEKGIFILFDSYQTLDYIANTDSGYTGSNLIWNSNSTAFMAVQSDGSTANTDADNRDGIYFTGTNAETNAVLKYRTITHSYKMIYFCHAGQDEFNSTSNHTYNHKKAYFRPEEADSLYITEIGLYDNDDTLLAYAKLSEPVEKSKLDTLTFKVELQL